RDHLVLSHTHSIAVFFFHPSPTTEIYPLSLHDALPISTLPSPRARHAVGLPRAAVRSPPRPRAPRWRPNGAPRGGRPGRTAPLRSEEHTSELQSLRHLVCRLLLEKKKKKL